MLKELKGQEGPKVEQGQLWASGAADTTANEQPEAWSPELEPLAPAPQVPSHQIPTLGLRTRADSITVLETLIKRQLKDLIRSTEKGGGPPGRKASSSGVICAFRAVGLTLSKAATL